MQHWNDTHDPGIGQRDEAFHREIITEIMAEPFGSEGNHTVGGCKILQGLLKTL